jgi:hypothetical protein
MRAPCGIIRFLALVSPLTPSHLKVCTVCPCSCGCKEASGGHNNSSAFMGISKNGIGVRKQAGERLFGFQPGSGLQQQCSSALWPRAFRGRGRVLVRTGDSLAGNRVQKAYGLKTNKRRLVKLCQKESNRHKFLLLDDYVEDTNGCRPSFLWFVENIKNICELNAISSFSHYYSCKNKINTINL